VLSIHSSDQGPLAQPPSGALPEAVRRRRARMRPDDMVGMGYFPDEVGLENGWPEPDS
jgi:hypothetical protein